MTSGRREKLEKADIRSLKNSNSPGFLTTTCQVMSPHVVQNVQAEAEKSLVKRDPYNTWVRGGD